MNAGKSTALLQSSYNYKERGMNTLVLAPEFDDRYGVGRVTSRIGIEADAITFKPDDDLYSIVAAILESEPLHCVLIDEAQFLAKNQVFQLGEVTHRLIRDAVKKDLLGHIVGRRLKSELSLIFREKNPLPALQRMQELDLLKYIHPKIRVTRTVLRLFRNLRRIQEQVPFDGEMRVCLFLAALSEGLGCRQRETLLERLAMPPRHRERLLLLVREAARAYRAKQRERAEAA